MSPEKALPDSYMNSRSTMSFFIQFVSWAFLNVNMMYPRSIPASLYPTIFVLGLSNTAAAVFALLSPFIAGTIAQKLGYESLFAVSLAMALVALFVSLRYLRNRPAEAGGQR